MSSEYFEKTTKQRFMLIELYLWFIRRRSRSRAREKEEREEKNKLLVAEMEVQPPSYDMACTCTGVKAAIPVTLQALLPQVSYRYTTYSTTTV